MLSNAGALRARASTVMAWTLASALAGLAVVLPFGETVEPRWLNENTLILGFAVLAVAAGTALVLIDRPRGLRGNTASIAPPLVAYALAVSLATLLRPDLPIERLQLLVIFLVTCGGFLALEACRPGTFFWVVTAAAVVHVGLAVAYRVSDSSYLTTRLTGGISAVGLGFDASMLAIVAIWFALSRRRWLRVTGLAVALIAGTVVVYTFSRAALVALLLGLLVAWIFAGRRRLVRLAAVVGVGAITTIVAWPWIIDYLSLGRISSLVGASGRFDIWATIVQNFNSWATGYGFGALYNRGGPDEPIFDAIEGVPSENAFLQALLIGGVVALVLFCVIVFVVGRALVAGSSTGYGLSWAIFIVLLTSAVFSAGLAGDGMAFWWALGAVSLMDHLRPELPPLPYARRIWTGRAGTEPT